MPMSPTTRERPLYSSYHANDVMLIGGGVYQHGSDVTVFTGKQKTVSEGHPRNRRTGNFESGGPFYTDRTECTLNTAHVSLKEDGVYHELSYDGECYCPLPSQAEMVAVGGFSSAPRSEDLSDLDASGATAIAQCSPVNPVSTLGTSFAETTHEGLPRLPLVQTWKKRTSIAKAAGSEYLNQVFGWLPLVSEITDVRDAARRHRDILNQYHRDEGRNVRREFHFPTENSSASYKTTGFADFKGQGNLWTIGQTPVERTITITSSKRKWFVGSFTYGTPHQTDSWGRAIGIGSDADKLYGIALTPDVVWELTPWSWAVDWFSNAGDVVKNITNFELAGQVMRYGYMMEESSSTITASLAGTGFYGDTSGAAPSSSIQHVSKVRAPANPFGFGLSWEGLSPTQILISAAIGITRL